MVKIIFTSTCNFLFVGNCTLAQMPLNVTQSLQQWCYSIDYYVSWSIRKPYYYLSLYLILQLGYYKLDGTRRAPVDGYASAWCDLNLWPFDLINMSQAHVVPRTYMTKFWWKYLRRYCIHPVFRVIAYGPRYICDQNWVKFPSSGCEIWCSQGFGSLSTVTLTFDLISMSEAPICKLPNFGKIS